MLLTWRTTWRISNRRGHCAVAVRVLVQREGFDRLSPNGVSVRQRTARKLLPQPRRILQQLRYLRFPKLRLPRGAVPRCLITTGD
jgi:hypothetical protein